MSPHTPSPWRVDWRWDVTQYPVFAIAGLSGDQKRDIDTLDANARLIAAAPDLLEALESCVHLAERDAYECQSTEFAAGADRRLEKVQAAIKKAQGVQE